MILLSTHLSAMMHIQVIYFQKIYDLIEHLVFVFRQFLKVRLTCSRHRTLQIFEFQFSKALFLSPFNKHKQRFGELEFEYLEGPMS